MDRRSWLDIALAVGAIGAWFLVYATCRLSTRPAGPAPAPASPDLGPEPPAVVHLLVNRWSLTEDAAESTLLDLAARRFVELRQPGNDPLHTTVHLPVTPPEVNSLRPYERQVLERIRTLAVGGVVPISALTFRDDAEAKSWDKRLRASVVADARAAGLSRRRFGPGVTALLVAAAAVAAVGVAAAALHYGWRNPQDDNPGLGAGVITFGILSAIAGRSPGERHTPAGRAAAARWLGVRDWLRGHEQFAELPPASVAVWDRYLAYGAAVGATHLASAVLDLGLGNRRLVWSSYGGTWHRVRVRYPRGWPRYGKTMPKLLLWAGVQIVIGGFLLKVFGLPRLPDASDTVGRVLDLVAALMSLAALATFLGAVHSLARSLIDLATIRTITGQVLWSEMWRATNGSDNRPARPWLYHLAVDDGTGDRTTAWGLPAEWAHRGRPGDTVTLQVRPWSRRVVALEIVASRDAPQSTSTRPVSR
jgi:hypothetical protein